MTTDTTNTARDAEIAAHPEVFWHYVNMVRKCYDPTHPEYPNEGAKGVKVDSKWLTEDGFHNFLEDVGDPWQGTAKV